jgi:hypothetical protein
VVPSSAVAQPSSEALVTEVANVRFYSDFWMNLHHTLYGAAWAKRPDAGTLRAYAGPLPSALDAPMTAEERAAWDKAVAYYDKHVADRDLLFGRGMVALKTALTNGDLASEKVGNDLETVLETAAPIYRRYFWPAHDRANRAWIAATVDRMKSVGPDTIQRLEKFYGVTWFASPVRADIVWVGNRQGAYTTLDPAHATISSGDPDNREWTSVEIVFHEFSHALVRQLQASLDQALGTLARDHRVLWHVVQFYLTGAAVQQALKAKGVDYVPYMYSTGLFERAWSLYREVLDANWRPYVEGARSLDEAIAGTVTMLARR